MCNIVEQTILGYEPFFDVRLFVFPEFAHTPPIYETVEKLRDQLAVELPCEHTDRYAALAKKHGCYLQTGTFLERDPQWDGFLCRVGSLPARQVLTSDYRGV